MRVTSDVLSDDLSWLLGSEGRAWLDRLASADETSVAVTTQVRRELSIERTRLVLEQVTLRRRARVKFADAATRFYTPLGLEQATDEWVAGYKASRFLPHAPIVDFCCGIGGDLHALSARGPATGIDRDPHVTMLAAANCPTAKVLAIDVTNVAVEEFAAWHIDPDRRPTGRRTTRVEMHEPSLEVLEGLLQRNTHAAIKLAPAAQLSNDWARRAELEWISREGECRQLVAWFGDFAERAGRRRATAVGRTGNTVDTFDGEPDLPLATSERVGRYLFEPDAAVLAARLTGALATRYQLAALTAGVAYLTSDTISRHPLLTTFEVLDAMPLDLKKLKAWLHARQIGSVEVKKRAVDVDPREIARRLKGPGGERATLIISPFEGRVTAIVARRLT